jgi:hypothetical protein
MPEGGNSEEVYEEEQFRYFATVSQDKPAKCVVCRKAGSKYRCPKCRVAYCSISHYRSHNLFCTERFFQAQVEAQLKATRAEPQMKKKMVELLQGQQAERAMDGSQLEEETKVEEVSQERLQELLEQLEQEQEVVLTASEDKCFQQYIQEVQAASQ